MVTAQLSQAWAWVNKFDMAEILYHLVETEIVLSVFWVWPQVLLNLGRLEWRIAIVKQTCDLLSVVLPIEKNTKGLEERKGF